jgi:NAD(P)-dependent dehydrogenase (short-subunit alcohol dehydrogenase family)
MDTSFEDKVALVTGGASGIGLATARAFAEAGAAVAIPDINEDAARAASDKLVTAGHKAIGIRSAVENEADAAAMVAQTVSTFGRLDAAFNNAGIHVAVAETADVEGSDFDRIIAINLRGIFTCMKHELRQMREQCSGVIVNCSSQSGFVGLPGLGAYTASKHGVIGLTKAAALEYAPRDIRINCICPGTTETPLVKGPRRAGAGAPRCRHQGHSSRSHGARRGDRLGGAVAVQPRRGFHGRTDAHARRRVHGPLDRISIINLFGKDPIQ